MQMKMILAGGGGVQAFLFPLGTALLVQKFRQPSEVFQTTCNMLEIFPAAAET